MKSFETAKLNRAQPSARPRAIARFRTREVNRRNPATGLSADDMMGHNERLPTKGFETEEKSIAEDKRRARYMRRMLSSGRAGWLNIKDVLWRNTQRLPHLSHPQIDWKAAERLIRNLEASVASGIPHRTLASSLEMRGIRQAVMGALLQAFEGYANEDLRTFTIINAQWTFTPGELDKVSATQIKKQFLTHLNRAGITTMPDPLICFLHGEFEPTRGHYVLHFHGVTTKEKAAALDRLKEISGYVPTLTGASPIRRPRVNNRAHQFTYMLKAFWPSKAVRDVGGVMQRDHEGRRIPEPFHSQVLLWLDRQRLKDMTLMNNCWSPRNGGPEAMRSLYLLIHQW